MIGRRKQRSVAARAAAPALGVLAGGAAVLGRRWSARRSGHEAAGPELWRCECGQGFRVSGLERHRVFWLEDAPEDDPVLSGRCPSCDRPLPANGGGVR